MLCDITPIIIDPNEFVQYGETPEVSKYFAERFTPSRIQTGIYRCFDSNNSRSFQEELFDFSDFDVLPDKVHRETLSMAFKWIELRSERLENVYREKYSIPYTPMSYYGLVDNPLQVLELWPHIVDDETPRVILCFEILRSEQPASGGFRYHKWGEYFGSQNPKCEYLYDDDHIDSIWSFQIKGLRTPCG